MTSAAQFTQMLTEISSALGNGLQAAAGNQNPFATMVGIVDQIRGFVDQAAKTLAQETAVPTGQVIWCSQCVGDAMASGRTDYEIRPAMTILAGQAICNVAPHSIVTMTPAAAAAAARGEQVTPAGIVLATGAVPRVGG